MNRRVKLTGRAALLLAWLCVAAVVLFDGVVMRRYIELLDDSGTLPTNAIPLHEIEPSDFADAYTWTRLALTAQQGGPWRIRSTNIDNAPLGRRVYWNSAFVHLVAAAGRVRALATHERLPTATERARRWFNAPLFLLVVVIFSSIVAWRMGAPYGVLLAFAMLGHRWFYDGFGAAYVDHHGLLTAATFGVVLGIALIGATWTGGAVLSAVSGAFGLWISAASVIPTIAFTGLAGIVSAVWFEGEASEHHFEPRFWRLWGVVGCALSLVAYVAEFAPGHMHLRLEVNHPLYALAWLGGGELVASVVERRMAGHFRHPWRTIGAGVLVVLPVAVIAAFRGQVFAPVDPSIDAMHRRIKEFQSLASLAHEFGRGMMSDFVIGFVLLLPALVLLRKVSDRARIAFAFVVSVLAVVLACVQARWWLTASGPEVVLLVLAVYSLFKGRRGRHQWMATAALSAVFAALAIVRISTLSAAVRDRAVSTADALEPMYRDAAIAIRTDHPRGKVVLLASPNASTAIGYFGGYQTLASLYWENIEGVRAAAEIYSSASDSAALTLIERRGVTHVAAIVPDDYLLDYLHIAHPGASNDELPNTFGNRLLSGRSFPRWLREIPFRPRMPETHPPAKALLFQVVPDQTDDEAAWAQAVAEVARSESRNAFEDFVRAVHTRSANGRADTYERAAQTSYEWRDHRLALALLDSANRLHPTRSSATTIGWILATSEDDRVRNGSTALGIARQIGGETSTAPATLDVTAAALAETGDMRSAIATAQRMLAIGRAANDSAVVARATERLKAYQAGRPWRQ